MATEVMFGKPMIIGPDGDDISKTPLTPMQELEMKRMEAIEKKRRLRKKAEDIWQQLLKAGRTEYHTWPESEKKQFEKIFLGIEKDIKKFRQGDPEGADYPVMTPEQIDAEEDAVRTFYPTYEYYPREESAPQAIQGYASPRVTPTAAPVDRINMLKQWLSSEVQQAPSPTGIPQAPSGMNLQGSPWQYLVR